ncbi:MAG TPA: DUF4384 domain-containing protein [Pyrinomonadaceae bacterium]|jgi:hypothetical protein|nr:DUF4384 domain-containing protein [Pyrinomonadaceae bacterium]
MPFKSLLTLAAFALIACAAPARAQQQQQQPDQKVIDDFVSTRGVSFDDPGKKTTPQRQTTHAGTPTHRSSAGGSRSPAAGGVASGSKGSSSSKTSQENTASNKKAPADKGVNANGVDGDADNGGVQTIKASSTTGSLQRIGLGYTVFMKDKSGGLLPVDTSQEYKSGDRIAISLEPNTEGYIYIFNAENDRDPMMLFPNVVLDKGTNAAHAHVRETYPADLDYAFEFDQTPANEHIYVIVSRHPLEGVPAGDALAQFCAKKSGDCYWQPTADVWARIKSGATGGRVNEAKNAQLAQLQKQPVPPSTLQRGLKIKRDDPAPAVVRVNASPDSDMLVTVIKLVHK